MSKSLSYQEDSAFDKQSEVTYATLRIVPGGVLAPG